MTPDPTPRTIRWRMHLAAGPNRVYRALDTSEGRRAFWAETADERDGRIAFRFSNGVEHEAAILDRTPAREYALDYFGGVARFRLRDDGAGGTDLELTHDGVDRDAWIEVHAGWLNVLFPLKAFVDHGIDLRNHDRRRTWTDGYADG